GGGGGRGVEEVGPLGRAARRWDTQNGASLKSASVDQPVHPGALAGGRNWRGRLGSGSALGPRLDGNRRRDRWRVKPPFSSTPCQRERAQKRPGKHAKRDSAAKPDAKRRVQAALLNRL